MVEVETESDNDISSASYPRELASYLQIEQGGEHLLW
jgi:hypothetical protein